MSLALHPNGRLYASSIDLFCADCGGAMRIPAATASDIDDICCKNKLVIHGQD